MYVVVRVPRRCLPSGTGRHGAIELLINNYEVVYGRHPSGAFYEPVHFENGKWVSADYKDLGPGEVITCEELGNLIALLTGGRTTSSIEELGGGDSATAVELNLPEPTLELCLRIKSRKLLMLLRHCGGLRMKAGSITMMLFSMG